MIRFLLAISALIGLAQVGDRLLGSGTPPRRLLPSSPSTAAPRRGPAAPQFGSFAVLMREHVLPLRDREPGRQDLGESDATTLRFEHGGTLWRVQGDTRMAPLLAAWEWSRAHPGEDPFQPGSGHGRRRALKLRDAVGWTGPTHFYVYADV